MKKFNIKLKKEQTNFLLSFPEKGMGYQLVDLVLKTGEILNNVVILNCEIAVTNKLIDNSDIKKIIIK